MKRRVVVTGIGSVSPLGLSKDQTWQNILTGKAFFTKSEVPEACFYGQVDNGFQSFLTKKEIRYMDRVSQMAVVASEECIKDSLLQCEKLNDENMAVCIGTAIGGIESFTTEITNSVVSGMDALSLTGMPKLLCNMVGANITMKFTLNAPVFTYSSACSSSTKAIGEAIKKIQYGDADIIMAGGSEASITRQALGSFGKLHALSQNNSLDKASVPFSKDRSGFVMSEGSTMLMLEEYEHAKERGANIYCELIGYGASSDGKSLVSPDLSGIKKCINNALKDGGVCSEEVEYINAHGTGTIANDKVESEAIRDIFGSKPYVSSTKAYHGHLLGATGALESALIALMIKNKTIIGQINVLPEEVALECSGLNLLLNKNAEYMGGKILKNSFGFGGDNVTLVFAKA